MVKLIKNEKVADEVVARLEYYGFEKCRFEVIGEWLKFEAGINPNWEYVALRYHGNHGFNVSTTSLTMYNTDKIWKFSREIQLALEIMEELNEIIPEMEVD